MEGNENNSRFFQQKMSESFFSSISKPSGFLLIRPTKPLVQQFVKTTQFGSFSEAANLKPKYCFTTFQRLQLF